MLYEVITRETRLWPHGNRAVYETYDRIFGCSGHGWANLQCIHMNLPYEELMAFYRAADVLLVTPRRDGMNLVAKEYCAAHIDGDGVLSYNFV